MRFACSIFRPRLPDHTACECSPTSAQRSSRSCPPMAGRFEAVVSQPLCAEPDGFVSAMETWQCSPNKIAKAIKHIGREAMKSFKVAEFNAPLAEIDEPTPQPSGTQVLIKVKAAGVCHSDLHIWEGGYDLGHGRKPLSLRDRGVSLPRTMW